MDPQPIDQGVPIPVKIVSTNADGICRCLGCVQAMESFLFGVIYARRCAFLLSKASTAEERNDAIYVLMRRYELSRGLIRWN